MKQIDEIQLEQDLGYRFGYVTEFMGFGKEDIDAVLSSAQYLAPKVDGLVDAVYVKLFQYDSTKRHFLPKQHGYDGAAPLSLADLSLDHPQIQFRKRHLGNYLKKLVTGPYDQKMIQYLDMVGKIHTPAAGNKDIHVPIIQMNVLMGFVSDALIATIFDLNVDNEQKKKLVRAFNKLLWIQNDFIIRHYCK